MIIFFDINRYCFSILGYAWDCDQDEWKLTGFLLPHKRKINIGIKIVALHPLRKLACKAIPVAEEKIL